MKAYDDLKNSVKAATNESLVSLFKVFKLDDNSSTSATVLYTALTAEMEDRGLLRWDDETCQYILTA